MRAVIQRVSWAELYIRSKLYAAIGKGMYVLVGVGQSDAQEDAAWLANKLLRMRIFENNLGLMDLSVQDLGLEILVVSQFTLYASTKKGNRPGFTASAPPEAAVKLYDNFVDCLRQYYRSDKIKTGAFGEYMSIKSENQGPVTIYIDTKNKE